MNSRFLVAAIGFLAVAVLAPGPAAGQGRAWTPPRTADGKPDIQGTFTFSTITPLQRPSGLEGKETLNAEEAAAFEASENKRLNRDLFDPEKGAAERRLRTESAGRRVVLQRVLVRAWQPAHRGQAHVAHLGSAGWESSLYGGRAPEERRTVAEVQLGLCRFLHRPQPG